MRDPQGERVSWFYHFSVWLALRLLSRAPRGDAIGAEATLFAGDLRQRAIVKTAYSFASASEPFVHFGLGARTQIDRIEIRWPNGERQRLAGLAPDRVHTILQRGAAPLPGGIAPRRGGANP